MTDVKRLTMRHDYILKRMHCRLADLSPLVRSQTLDPLKQNLPDLLKVNRICFLLDDGHVWIVLFCAVGACDDLLGCIVGHVLEHTNGDQVVVDVAAGVAGVHVNRVEHGDEVLLAQSIDVVADDEFEATEATRNYLVTFVLEGLADGYDDYAPSFILDLLSTRLYDLLEALDHGKFIRVMRTLQLLR